MAESTARVVSRPSEVHSLFGVEHRVVVSAAESNGVVGVVEITVPPGGGSPPHTNTNESLSWYVTEGSVRFERDGDAVQVEAGGGLCIPAGTPHTFANASDRPARVVMVAAPGGGEAFFREAAAVVPAVVPDGPPPPEVVSAFAEVAARYGIELLPPPGG